MFNEFDKLEFRSWAEEAIRDKKYPAKISVFVNEYGDTFVNTTAGIRKRRITSWANKKAHSGFCSFKIDVVIDDSGNHKEEYTMQRKSVGEKEFLTWAVDMFSKTAKIASPYPIQSKKGAAYMKRWYKPLRTMVYQIYFVDGKAIAEMKSREIYNRVSGIAMQRLIGDAIREMDENNLTISAPESIEKVAINLSRQKNYLRQAAAIALKKGEQ